MIKFIGIKNLANALIRYVFFNGNYYFALRKHEIEKGKSIGVSTLVNEDWYLPEKEVGKHRLIRVPCKNIDEQILIIQQEFPELLL
jgi:hypothetical protein